MQLLYYHYFQILSLLLAIVFYRGLKQFKLLGFIPFLAFVCFVELKTNHLSVVGGTSGYLANYYLLASTAFYFPLLQSILKWQQVKKIVFWGIAMLVVIIVLLNYFFIQGRAKFNNESFMLLSIVFSIFSMIAILKIALIDEDDKHKSSQLPYFIILSVTLLFFLGSLIVLGLYNFIIFKNITIFGKHLYNIVMPILNVIMYGGYSYVFYLCYNLTRI
ncbi:MAG: hypothetical protein J0I09_09120 [Sphingobacteriia bacterium]|nr:hypothetical protein [Sphingobacteriia bacterium]